MPKFHFLNHDWIIFLCIYITCMFIHSLPADDSWVVSTFWLLLFTKQLLIILYWSGFCHRAPLSWRNTEKCNFLSSRQSGLPTTLLTKKKWRWLGKQLEVLVAVQSFASKCLPIHRTHLPFPKGNNHLRCAVLFNRSGCVFFCSKQKDNLPAASTPIIQ